MQWLIANWDLVIVGASVLANAIPNDTDNKVLKVVDKVVNTVALNGNVKGVLNKK